MSTLTSWLLPGNFLPHGHCYLWRADVLCLHVGSDALLATSYCAIAPAIGFLLRRRPAVLRNCGWPLRLPWPCFCAAPPPPISYQTLQRVFQLTE
jgi:hypothetical protein